jgi:hypothetical protein
MLEPTTASIGLYLITHPPRFHKHTLRKPMFLKRVCKRVRSLRHNEAIRDAIWDELGESLVDNVHILPSWSVVLLYVCLFVVVFVV